MSHTVDKQNIIIRRAVSSDVPRISEITKEAFRKYAAAARITQLDALNESYQDIEKDLQSKIVIVAELHGVVAGSVRLQILEDNTAYLTRFGVCLNHQGKGIGKRLLENVDEVVAQYGVDELRLHTATLARENVILYYRAGFYIKSTSNDRGYVRGLFVKEYKQGDNV